MTNNKEMRFKQREMKKYAAHLLGERGNLLRMIFALLIVIGIIGTVMHIFESVCYFIFFDNIPIYALLLEIILVLALALPFFMGISRMAYRMCLSEKTEISELFRYFEKDKALGAYKVALMSFGGVMLQLALAFALGWIISYAMDGFSGKMIPDDTYVYAITIFLLISGMLPSVYILPNAFFRCENAKEAREIAAKSNFLPPIDIIVFNISFVPLALISALFFGILFIVYTIPLYLVALQMFIIENQRKKENL